MPLDSLRSDPVMRVGRRFLPVAATALPPLPTDPGVVVLPLAPGTPVHAMQSGRVVAADGPTGEVVLRVEGEVRFVYRKLLPSSTTVSAGDTVESGDVIGVVAPGLGRRHAALELGIQLPDDSWEQVATWLVGMPDPLELYVNPPDAAAPGAVRSRPAAATRPAPITIVRPEPEPEADQPPPPSDVTTTQPEARQPTPPPPPPPPDTTTQPGSEACQPPPPFTEPTQSTPPPLVVTTTQPEPKSDQPPPPSTEPVPTDPSPDPARSDDPSASPSPPATRHPTTEDERPATTNPRAAGKSDGTSKLTSRRHKVRSRPATAARRTEPDGPRSAEPALAGWAPDQPVATEPLSVQPSSDEATVGQSGTETTNHAERMPTQAQTPGRYTATTPDAPSVQPGPAGTTDLSEPIDVLEPMVTISSLATNPAPAAEPPAQVAPDVSKTTEPTVAALTPPGTSEPEPPPTEVPEPVVSISVPSAEPAPPPASNGVATKADEDPDGDIGPETTDGSDRVTPVSRLTGRRRPRRSGS